MDYQTIDPHPPPPFRQKRAPGWVGTIWCPCTNSSLQIAILQIHQMFNISYFPQFNLSSQKKYLFPKNDPKIYTKLTAREWSNEIRRVICVA